MERLKKHCYESLNELVRLINSTNKKVENYIKIKKINQYSTLYFYEDNSRLLINKNTCESWHMNWKGTKNDTYLRPCKI